MALPSAMDTSNIKESTFDPIPAGTYHATVYEVSEVEAKGDGKMPEGTPGINVQLRLVDGQGYDNRRVFKRYYIAPDDYANKEVMDSMLYSFLKVTLGEEVAKSKKFNLAKAVADDEFGGRPVRVKVVLNEAGDNNNVKSILEPKGSVGSGDAEGLLP